MTGTAPTQSRGRCTVCHATYTDRERFCSLDGGAVVAEAAPADPRVGRTVDGRYFVRRLVGKGGMGAVYEADHVGLDKRVAVKFLLRDDADRDALARFRREARAASRITHGNVVQIFDVGSEAETGDYIAMEYLEGRDLRQVLAQEGALAPARVVRLGRQILDGLAAIHAGGIVHRDIKPANLVIVGSGDAEVVKIMDFGISKAGRGDRVAETITGTGQVIGTPQFMAPEQLLGLQADARSDLYAVGITLYSLLAGALPFSDTSFTKVAARHFTDTAPLVSSVRAEVSPALARVIACALAKAPEDRFPDARAFAAALEQAELDAGADATIVESEVAADAAQSQHATVRHGAVAPVSVRVDARDALATPPRRRWTAVIAAGVGLGLLVGGALALGRRPPPRAPAAHLIAPRMPDAAERALTAVTSSPPSTPTDAAPVPPVAPVGADGLGEGSDSVPPARRTGRRAPHGAPAHDELVPDPGGPAPGRVPVSADVDPWARARPRSLPPDAAAPAPATTAPILLPPSTKPHRANPYAPP